MNTDVFIQNKKELIPEGSLLPRVMTIILYAMCLVIFCYVIAVFIDEQFYNASSADTYTWVLVFFLAQILGIVVTSSVALWIEALGVFYCCKKKKKCLYKFMRGGSVIYEDYKYVY